MRKYWLRYLIFWAPAFAVACFYNNGSSLSLALQWALALLMVGGWAINTAMAAAYSPRKVLSALFMYLGAHLLIITTFYQHNTGTRGPAFRLLCGAFSFTPLDIIVTALLDFTIPHELYLAFFLTAVCALGYVAGLLYRWHNPNPYRPRIRDK